MGGCKCIQMFLSWILVLQCAASRTGLSTLNYNVRVGDNVTMACENVIKGRHKCDSTTWAFSRRSDSTVELVKLGQIGENAGATSGRLSVTEDCSLLLWRVREEDVGRYYCQQYISGQKQSQDAVVHLSVLTMTEEKNGDEVTLRCSVWTHEGCRHKVRWLFKGYDVKKQNQGVRTSASPCNGSVTFNITSLMYRSRHDSLDCEVTLGNRGQLFAFRLQPPGEESTTSVTESPTVTETAGTTDTSFVTKESSKLTDWLWLFVTVPAVVLLLLIVTVMIFIKGRRTRGQRRRRNDDGQTSNPAEARSGMADPEDGVSYASVSYTRKTNSKDQVQDKNGDEVTYSTVKASSTAPTNLYASITNP